MQQLIKWLPTELAHSLAPMGLELYSSLYPYRSKDFERDPLWWRGLYFRNRFGIAGGLDKNADLLPVWQKLGCGFIEVGTVTPRPQLSNPGRIIDRNWNAQLLWNKMGFPSAGCQEVFVNVHKWRDQVRLPIFINVGKNRETQNENAAEDYLLVMEKMLGLADAFVINVSSPNTQGLRDLQNSAVLKPLLKQVTAFARSTPVLLKLSPDLSDDQLREAVETMAETCCSGLILTNTTLQRPGSSDFPKEGGLSGKFLAPISKKFLVESQKILGSDRKNYLIVSAGGVLSPDDFIERRKLGADLVQSYSGWVFYGPGLLRDTLKKIEAPQ